MSKLAQYLRPFSNKQWGHNYRTIREAAWECGMECFEVIREAIGSPEILYVPTPDGGVVCFQRKPNRYPGMVRSFYACRRQIARSRQPKSALPNQPTDQLTP